MKRKILSLFLVMAVLTTLFAVPTYADTKTYDLSVDGDGSITATYDTETKVLTISGSGVVKSKGLSTFLTSYGSSVTKLVIEEGITELNAYAFASLSKPDYAEGNSTNYTLSKLEELSLPSTLQSIGNFAFYGIGSSSSSLIINLPEGLTTIGNSAFRTSGAAFSLPSTVTTIGEYAFKGATKLTSISEMTNLETIGTSAFLGCIGITTLSIPSKVVSIGDTAFSKCSGIASIVIPSSVKSIGSNAFQGCGHVEDITINTTGYKLGGYALFGRVPDGLYSSVNPMGSSITGVKTATIAASEVYTITELEDLGYTVNAIGTATEEDKWNSYPDAYVYDVGADGDNVKAYYDNRTFTVDIVGTGATVSSSPLSSIANNVLHLNVHEGVTYLGDLFHYYANVGTRKYLEKIETISLPSSLKTLGSGAFSYMNHGGAKVNIVLPEGMEVVESDAFGTAKASSLVIPSTIKEFGSQSSFYLYGHLVNKIQGDQPAEVATMVGSPSAVYLYSTNTSELTAAQASLDAANIHFLDNPATSGVLENGITWTYDPDTQTLTFDTTNATSTEIPSYSVGYQPWYACSYHYGAPRTYGFGGVTGIGSGALMGLDYGSVGNIDYYGNSSLGGAITSQTGVPTTYGGSSNPNTDSDLGGSGGGSTGNDPSQNPSDDTSETGIWVFVDDVEVDFPDVQPRVWFGEVYAPLRFINQDLGAKVLWNNESRTATIQRTTANGSKVEIELTVGSSSMVVNGKEYTSEEIGMEATVLFENGRLLLPGRAIVKAWDDVFFKNVYTATAYKDYYYYQDDGESEDKLEEVPEIDNFVSNGVEITPDNEEEVLSDYGETKILVNAESTFFFVSTPILVSVYMDSTGNVAVSDNLYIENKCASGPVVIEEIKVIKANQWVLRNYTTFDFKNAVADSKFIGLEINGVTVGEDGSVIMNEDLYSSILHSESKELEINAKLPAQRKAIKEIGAGIIFTVDFDKYGE